MIGRRSQWYRNARKMAINALVGPTAAQGRDNKVGFVDLWDCFDGKEEINMRDGVHFVGKGAVFFADVLKQVGESGPGNVQYSN